MSILAYKQKISEGDLVIVCRGYERMFSVTVQPRGSGHVIQVKGGAIHHDTLIGKEFGSKVMSSNGKNWIIVLHPTPELWTLTLPHRTQILYTTDISMITLQLGLRPGSKVVESGTGSGGVSHALARSISPNGHLYTFEFHKQRADLARLEFVAHGLSNVVTLECRDVCSEGFGVNDLADAVFLDLPNPWQAVESAKLAIRKTGGRISSFSPCIEQVQKTVEELEKVGFDDIETLECLLRPYEVHSHILAIPNTGMTDYSGDLYSQGNFVHSNLSSHTIHTARPTRKIPGHTGFLTFATLHL